jgi:tellurite resistance protein
MQIQLWLRGLLTVAWADGQFDAAEKVMINTMVESELAPKITFETLEPVSPEALADSHLSEAAAQNFLRMAVMVALANGVYSDAENAKIMAFAEALPIQPAALRALQSTLTQLIPTHSLTAEPLTTDPLILDRLNKALTSSSAPSEPGIATPPKTETPPTDNAAPNLEPSPSTSKAGYDPLKPAREWLDQLNIEDPRFARFICKLIPAQCPFERDIQLFGRKTVHIPPMCKINPLYEQLVGLRFRALSYLADDCKEDISAYI